MMHISYKVLDSGLLYTSEKLLLFTFHSNVTEVRSDLLNLTSQHVFYISWPLYCAWQSYELHRHISSSKKPQTKKNSGYELPSAPIHIHAEYGREKQKNLQSERLYHLLAGPQRWLPPSSAGKKTHGEETYMFLNKEGRKSLGLYTAATMDNSEETSS